MVTGSCNNVFHFIRPRCADARAVHVRVGFYPRPIVSQQRLRPRRFDSTIKCEPKLRVEPVSFLFLDCFSFEVWRLAAWCVTLLVGYTRNPPQFFSFVFSEFKKEKIEKQTKNRNETSSNLSLGTRLMVLSKRLGHKCCCDTTPDRCIESNRLIILTLHCEKNAPNIEGFERIPGPEAYQIKNEYAQCRRLRRINSLPKRGSFHDLSASTKPKN